MTKTTKERKYMCYMNLSFQCPQICLCLSLNSFALVLKAVKSVHVLVAGQI